MEGCACCTASSKGELVIEEKKHGGAPGVSASFVPSSDQLEEPYQPKPMPPTTAPEYEAKEAAPTKVTENDAPQEKGFQEPYEEMWSSQKGACRQSKDGPEFQRGVIPTGGVVIEDGEPPRKREIQVVVAKNATQDLGIDVDYGDRKTLRIVRIKAGFIQDWNSNPANKEIQVRPNDRIVSVNGVGGTVELIIGEIKKSDTLDLTVQRNDELLITVEKASADQTIGLDIDRTIVRVITVKEGPIQDYNARLGEEQADFSVKSGDRVLECNGLAEPDKIIEEMRTQKTLKMLVFRA